MHGRHHRCNDWSCARNSRRPGESRHIFSATPFASVILHRRRCYISDDAIEFPCGPVATDIAQAVLDFGAKSYADFFRGSIGGNIQGTAALNQHFTSVAAAESFLCRLKHEWSPWSSECLSSNISLQLSGRANIASDFEIAPVPYFRRVRGKSTARNLCRSKVPGN